MPINDDLEAIFKKIRKEKQLKSKYVFTDDKSRLLKSIKRSFNSAVDDAKIEDFRFHDLRHTFCSNLLLADSDLKDVKEKGRKGDRQIIVLFLVLQPVV